VGAGVVASFLLLSCVRGLDRVRIAVAVTYPLWYWMGWDHGRRARP
jgi:hypothetical protein